MPTKVKRKVRRRDTSRGINRLVVASLVGADPREHYHFRLLDSRDALPFPSIDRGVYLRTYQSF